MYNAYQSLFLLKQAVDQGESWAESNWEGELDERDNQLGRMPPGAPAWSTRDALDHFDGMIYVESGTHRGEVLAELRLIPRPVRDAMVYLAIEAYRQEWREIYAREGGGTGGHAPTGYPAGGKRRRRGGGQHSLVQAAAALKAVWR